MSAVLAGLFWYFIGFIGETLGFRPGTAFNYACFGAIFGFAFPRLTLVLSEILSFLFHGP